MPAQDFTVHVDPDELARHDLAAALAPASGSGDDRKHSGAAHHGAGDPRQAARERSDRAHASRGAQGGGRSYAFRRS